MGLFLGLDLGTTGCRGCLVDEQGKGVFDYALPLPPSAVVRPRHEQDPRLWWDATRELIERAREHGGPPEALAVAGTSGTLMVVNGTGRPLGPALMYDDARTRAEAEQIAHQAPPETAAHGPGSGLAKLLWLAGSPHGRDIRHALTPVDWINGRLMGHFGLSDENNALKLGYDPVAGQWPAWLDELGIDRRWLPEVHPAGTPLGAVHRSLTEQLGLPVPPQVIAGTTDSIAGLIAAGAHGTGEAVTSLGTTLAVKVLGAAPIFEPRYGIYSHRLGGHWLAGGASNSGAGVLRRFFDDAELERLSARLDPGRPTGLSYYPLTGPGERFPWAAPELAPRLSPRPADPARFLQGILEGIAEIECQGYTRLRELGAPFPSRVYTVGGGARNTAWTAIRRRVLGVELRTPARQDAAYGAALLARDGMLSHAGPTPPA